MSTTQNPTILIVTGAWHGPAHFEPLSKLLNERNFPTSCPALASIGGSSTATMYDDAKIIRAELDRLILTEQKEVIVLLHSYGGIVGTQAVHASLGRRNRKAQGLPGGVIHLIYMSAFLLPIGKTLAPATADGKLPPEFGEKSGLLPPPMPEVLFYNDLPPAQKSHYASLLRPQSAASFLTPLTYAAWQHHPVSYLQCTNDNAIALEKQRGMIADAEAEADWGVNGKGDRGIEGLRTGRKVGRRFECEAGHSPFLSMPEVVVDVVMRVAAGGVM